MISQIVFFALLLTGVMLFTKNLRVIIRNIKLGRPEARNDQPSLRLMTMVKVALGQSKMVVRPVAGLMHILVYVGFIIINIEVIEIIIDGLAGTHRVLHFLGTAYSFLIASFEWLALGVIAGCVVFLFRRNLVRLKRLQMKELEGWPKSDANIILITEIALMTAFLTMNLCDSLLQSRGYGHYQHAGFFPVSRWFSGLFSGFSNDQLFMIERSCWWFHIVGILAFLNYIPYSKHFHILLAFPNVYYSNLNPKGKFSNMAAVTNEVKLMLDPAAVVSTPDSTVVPGKFGAKDIYDLSWKNLMDAYSCTECGRCTSVCPANLTGKKLSPRKIMMDTRDRVEAVGRGIDKNGKGHEDGKSLLNDYISPEELWACTTCNACTEACPVNIDPLSIIVELRRFMVMEQSAAPAELNTIFGNMENNQAPWKYPPSDRLNWASEGV
jgi:ferredoxin